MKYTTLNVFICLLLFSLLCLLNAFGDSSGSLGLSVSQVINDRSGGIIGEYNYDGDPISVEIDAQHQFGDLQRGKIHTELLFDIGAVGVKLINENTLRGETLDTLGRNQTGFLALNVPVDIFPNNILEMDVGIGGSNASPWGEPSAADVLKAEGFNPDIIETLELGDLYPDPEGIPFREGTRLQVYTATAIRGIKFKGIFDIAGEGEKAQQIHARYETSTQLGVFRLGITGELGVMFLGGETHSDTAFFANLLYRFGG